MTLDREAREEAVLEAIATLRLEGMGPDAEDVRLARAYIEGEMTLADLIEIEKNAQW